MTSTRNRITAARALLTVVERADDGVSGFAEVPGVGMPARLVRAGHWSLR